MAYFPNGDAGEYLESQCAICPLGKEGVACPVKLVQLMYNYDQLKAGQDKLREALTMLVNKKGDCQVRPLLEQPKSRFRGDPPAWLEETAKGVKP